VLLVDNRKVAVLVANPVGVDVLCGDIWKELLVVGATVRTEEILVHRERHRGVRVTQYGDARVVQFRCVGGHAAVCAVELARLLALV